MLSRENRAFPLKSELKQEGQLSSLFILKVLEVSAETVWPEKDKILADDMILYLKEPKGSTLGLIKL